MSTEANQAHVPRLLVETPEEIEYELRSAEGAMWTAGRLLIGVITFAFASLAFAYFYLRSTNSDNLWRPNRVTAPTSFGLGIFVLVVVSTLLTAWGLRVVRKGRVADWSVAGWTAVILSLFAVALQILELTRLPFFPGSSGYASCFVGWASMNAALLLGSCYWLETLLARSLRLRRAVAADGGASESMQPVARLFRAKLEGCTHFWLFAGVVNLFFWIIFYVVK